MLACRLSPACHPRQGAPMLHACGPAPLDPSSPLPVHSSLTHSSTDAHPALQQQSCTCSHTPKGEDAHLPGPGLGASGPRRRPLRPQQQVVIVVRLHGCRLRSPGLLLLGLCGALSGPPPAWCVLGSCGRLWAWAVRRAWACPGLLVCRAREGLRGLCRRQALNSQVWNLNDSRRSFSVTQGCGGRCEWGTWGRQVPPAPCHTSPMRVPAAALALGRAAAAEALWRSESAGACHFSMPTTCRVATCRCTALTAPGRRRSWRLPT